MLRKLLFLVGFVIGFHSLGFTQTTQVTAKKIVAQDSLWIFDRWIKLVTDDSTLNVPFPSNTLGTVFAIKSYIENRRGVDSLRSLNDSTLRVFRKNFFYDITIKGSLKDDNNFPTALGFNTGSGVLTQTLNGSLSPLTVDLDGRYVQSVIERSDSLFYITNGVETFIGKDDGGGAGSANLDTIRNAIQIQVTNDVGTDAFLPLVNKVANKAGLMSPSDKSILDSIATSATYFRNPRIGDTLLVRENDSTFLIKSLRNGSNITFTVTDTTITIDAPGAVSTFANEGLKKVGDSIKLNRPILRATLDGKVDYPEVYITLTGSDGNNGQTETTPKQNISALNTVVNSTATYRGQALGVIKAGDEYRAMIDLSTANISIGAYGMNSSDYKRPPRVSGADVHNSGWSLVGATSFTYTKNITLSIGSNFGYDYPIVVEIDTLMEKYAPYTARKYLTAVASQAAVETTPGSFYHANLTNPVAMYIRPTSGVPGSNRYRYEVATRRNSISSSTSLAGVNIQDMELFDAGGGYGVFGAATGGGAAHPYMSRIVFMGGGTHKVVSQGGVYEDNVFLGSVKGLTSGSIAGAFYKDNGTGVYGILRRNIFLDEISAWTAHESGSISSRLEYVSYENNYWFSDTTFAGAVFGSEFVRRLDITNNYIDQATNFVVSAADTLNIVGNVARNITNKSNTSGTGTPTYSRWLENVWVFTPPSSGITRTAIESTQTVDSFIVSKNIIHVKSTNDQAESAQVIGRASAFASPTPTRFTYNIIIADVPATRNLKIGVTDQNGSAGVTAGFISDYNIFILLKGAGFQWTLLNPASGGPNVFDLTDWQTRSGRDANSLFFDLTAEPLGLKKIFVDPDNGNWTLTNSSEAAQIRALFAGPKNPPTFYPTRPSYEQAVATMQNRRNSAALASQWQYTPASSGGNVPDGSETKLQQGTNITITGLGTIPSPYIISATAGAAGLDSTVALGLFHRTIGNDYSSAANARIGSTNGQTYSFIQHGINRGFVRPTGQLLIGSDSTGVVNTLGSLVIKNIAAEFTSALAIVGTTTGTNPAVNITPTVTATANNQILEVFTVIPALATGGFTGISTRVIKIHADLASANSQFYMRNNAASGTAEFLLEGSNGQIRLTTAGVVWAAAGNLNLRPQGTSNHINFESATGVTMVNMRNGLTRFGDGTLATAKLQMAGNLTIANNGTSGVLLSQLASTITDNSTAASGTVAHKAVNSFLQPTLASTNTSVTNTNASTVYIENSPAAGANTTNTNPWALFIAAGKSFLAPGVVVGAGTSSLAPLQLTSGTDVSSPAAGMFYYNGTRLAFSPSTTIRRIPLSNDVAPTNGQLLIGNGTDFTTASLASADGSITITPGAGTLNIATTVVALSGTYTPTLTNVANIDASVAAVCHYIRVGNVVHVSGTVQIDPTTTSTVTQLGLSLPIAASFAVDGELAGVGSYTNSSDNLGFPIITDITNDRAEIRFFSSSVVNQVIHFTFTYRLGGS
jgi:hypothetical protein